jgi:septal ring factor EnvC (AmiA/AmiB activator)
MYHFKQFLDNRPNDAKREVVQAHYDHAKINFAVTLPNSPIQNAEAVAKIQTENLTVKRSLDESAKKIVDLEKQLAQAKEESSKLQESLKQAQTEPVTKPTRDFDLD